MGWSQRSVGLIWPYNEVEMQLNWIVEIRIEFNELKPFSSAEIRIQV